MSEMSVASKKRAVKKLQKQVEELRSQLKQKRRASNEDEYVRWKMQKMRTDFVRIRNPEGPDIGRGKFFFYLNITALNETVYVPVSIASSKKPTGFVYLIEGTAKGTIYRTDISCRGEGVTQITLGTLLYAKIPKGKTASFRTLVEMRGKVGKEYKIVINRINYKLNPRDARYQRFNTTIRTKTLRFR